MTHPLPANAQLAVPGQSLEDPNASIQICPSTQTFDVTSSCEFGVGKHISGLEAVCTTVAGTSPSFTIGLDAYDIAAQAWENLITSAAITGAATTVIKVNPHIVAATNVSATRLVRRRMRVTVTFTSGVTTGSIVVNAQ